DTVVGAPPRVRGWIEWIRRHFPRFLWRPMRICGPPVSNGECGICFDSQLPPSDRRTALRLIAKSVLRSAGFRQAVFFKDFTDEAVAEYASELETLGFFRVAPGPGTRLDLSWDSFDGYLGAMRKKYRGRVRHDLKLAEELEFSLLDSFADLAPTAA